MLLSAQEVEKNPGESSYGHMVRSVFLSQVLVGGMMGLFQVDPFCHCRQRTNLLDGEADDNKPSSDSFASPSSCSSILFTCSLSSMPF